MDRGSTLRKINLEQTDRTHIKDPTEAGTTKGRRLSRILGWALAAAGSVALLLLAQIQALTDPVMALGALALVILSLLIVLFGVGLLLVGYREWFKQPWGFIFWIFLFFLTLYIENQPQIPAGWREVITTWSLASALAIGPTLGLYLWHRDHSVRVLAVTLLLQMWLLYTMGQILGWSNLLSKITGGLSDPTLWPFQVFLCVSIWVCLIAPLAFIWHTIILINRERRGVDTSKTQPETAKVHLP
jgi:asparagine N-glycosylation enzyme membrane subunit Stt3